MADDEVLQRRVAELERALQAHELRPDRPVFHRRDLRDARFFQANREAILEAVKDGRIVDDGAWRVPDRRPTR